MDRPSIEYNNTKLNNKRTNLVSQQYQNLNFNIYYKRRSVLEQLVTCTDVIRDKRTLERPGRREGPIVIRVTDQTYLCRSVKQQIYSKSSWIAWVSDVIAISIIERSYTLSRNDFRKTLQLLESITFKFI